MVSKVILLHKSNNYYTNGNFQVVKTFGLSDLHEKISINVGYD